MTSEAASVIKDEAAASALLDARALGAPSRSPSYSRCLATVLGSPASRLLPAQDGWVKTLGDSSPQPLGALNGHPKYHGAAVPAAEPCLIS